MRSVRICILSERPFPDPGTDTEQLVRTASALLHEGAEIELVIPADPAHWLEGRRARAQRIARYYGVPDDLPVRGLPALPRPGGLAEMTRGELLFGSAQAASFLAAALAWIGWSRPDVVHVRTPASLGTAILTRRPAVYDTYRVDVPVALRPLVRRAAFVVAHSALAASSIVGVGVPAERVRVVRNGWEPASMEPRLERGEARALLGLGSSRLVALYAGHCRPDKGADELIEVAALRPEIDFVLVGAAPDDLARLAWRSAGLPNVKVWPRVPPGEVPVWLYAADVLLIPTPRARPGDPAPRTVLPIKTYQYMVAGRAILAPRTADIEEVLEDGHTACLFSPLDAGDAARRLGELGSSPELRARIARAALEESQAHTFRERARRLIEIYRASAVAH
ncbi:MAG: glycosyltransferase [Deltaproteobacteria bacterium]|nr:glycosyltransferase [Deltaproteobacteria bacterium]